MQHRKSAPYFLVTYLKNPVRHSKSQFFLIPIQTVFKFFLVVISFKLSFLDCNSSHTKPGGFYSKRIFLVVRQLKFEKRPQFPYAHRFVAHSPGDATPRISK